MNSDPAKQQQFLKVIDRETATARFHSHLNLVPLGLETVTLHESLNRILSENVVSQVNVSSFDRSNVDGFAIQAEDSYGASEDSPKILTLNKETISTGVTPQQEVNPGSATLIATGGMIPRGANAVVMVEDTDIEDGKVVLSRAVSTGDNMTFTGTDISLGETVLWKSQKITSREIGILAAIGLTKVSVFQRPKVAIISTGNEIVPPGEDCPPGFVYDSNLYILAAAVTEAGGEPIPLGVVRDDEELLQKHLSQALEYDIVVLSGGTSKGAGDLSYRAVEKLTDPGIIAHGVSLKPGKPICLAVTGKKPIVILPGFPTSAIFTFHEFVAPVIRHYAGVPKASPKSFQATIPFRLNSARGRTEYCLVNLIRKDSEWIAYPLGKGSGSVTTFSLADGFIKIDQHTEYLDEGEIVSVQLLSEEIEPADVVIIGSHCLGLDLLMTHLKEDGFSAKALHVGSTSGLKAARRNECDLAGVHLYDDRTDKYNTPFLNSDLVLIRGYHRQQAFIHRNGDKRFQDKDFREAIDFVLQDSQCRMVNRNTGSGTRILTDQLLKGIKPTGYAAQAKSHNAVAASISQNRADWGIAIEQVVRQYDLTAIPIQKENYDFIIHKSRMNSASIEAVQAILQSESFQRELQGKGFQFDSEIGEIISGDGISSDIITDKNS